MEFMIILFGFLIGNMLPNVYYNKKDIKRLNNRISELESEIIRLKCKK